MPREPGAALQSAKTIGAYTESFDIGPKLIQQPTSFPLLWEFIPFRVVNSREHDHNLLLSSHLPAQKPEFLIRSNIIDFTTISYVGIYSVRFKDGNKIQ